MDTREVWEELAESWTHFRTKPEGEILQLASEYAGNKVLDVGCGNGRNMLPFIEKNFCVGLDFSKNMIKEAKKLLASRGHKLYLVVGDMKYIPFKNDAFDLALFIRTLHHGETKIDRLEALIEVKRVSKKVVISVWKKWQIRFLFKLLRNLFQSDIFVEWRKKNKVVKRFYHLYTKKELEKDAMEVGLTVKKIWEDGKGNIWCIAEKV